MIRTSAFRIAIPLRRAASGRRDATFAVVQSARGPHGGWRTGALRAGEGRASRGDARCRLHGVEGRDGARAAA